MSDEKNPSGGNIRRTRESPSLKARAIRYLARRDYSRLELQKKLRPYLSDFQSDDDLVELLDELEKKGYLSDERFARSRLRTRLSRYGNARLAYELKNNGVSSEIITRTMQELGAGEYERAQALWRRRFGQAATDFKERGKQMRYLLARGFSMDVVRKVVKDEEFDDID